MPLVMPVQMCVCAFPHTHFIITECLVSTMGGGAVGNACANVCVCVHFLTHISL